MIRKGRMEVVRPGRRKGRAKFPDRRFCCIFRMSRGQAQHKQTGRTCRCGKLCRPSKAGREPQKLRKSLQKSPGQNGMGLATVFAEQKYSDRHVSLNAIAGSALSALKTSQAALGVVSNNISNLNTPGYARRVINFESLSANGQLMGVDVASIQ